MYKRQVMTIGVPLIFAYAETPAEKLERLRKELEDIKSNISACLLYTSRCV